MKFLIADDDDDTREFLRATLESRGHDIDLASNGLEALEMATHSPPDIIISDILMPEMDGFMLCREIKGDASLHNIPFVFYSGTYLEPEHEKLGLALGASVFIRKPMEPAALLDVIETVISKHQSTVPAVSIEDVAELARMHETMVVRKLAEKVQELEMEIAERKQADALVIKLSQAIEQAGEAIVITDRGGIIEYINPAFTKLTGYSAKEAIGQTPRLLKSDNQDAAFYEEMWKTIINGDVWHGKMVDRKKDGSFYPAMLTISPIFNQSDDPTYCSHYVGIQSDLTKIEDMEHQFHQAQKMEALGTLVGGIAHDFNNILAGITGGLYLAKKRVHENPDVIQRLTSVEQLTLRAAEMIKQLLTFSRKDIVSMKEMPLTPFIKETLKFLRVSVPENIIIHQNICSGDLQIKGDGTQLHQVLMNLVNNARDALEGVDNPVITIRLEEFHADDEFIETHTYFTAGLYAHLGVEDKGCGIPEHQLEHLFEPFFMTKEVGKGTGLGLAMVFGAVKSHHGFVEVDSIEGEGSTFHIYIPLLEQENSVMPLSRQLQVANGHGETILLVDDEEYIIETGKEVLETLGYQVLTATNGQQAVAIFEAHPEDIDLCIFDIVMPVLGGDEAAKQVRLMQPDAKIIFATGYDKNLQNHLDGKTVLSKPFSIVEMSQLIRQQLDD